MIHNEYLKYLWNYTKKSAGCIFTAVAVLVCFVTPDDLLKPFGLDKIWMKVLCFAVLCLISVLTAALLARLRKDRPVTLYDKEGSAIEVAFGDITSYMKDNTGGAHYTVVFPVNKDMDRILNPERIKPSSVHGQWLSYLQTLPPDEYRNVEKQLENCRPRVGDCLLVRNTRNVDYILAVSSTVQDEQPVCTETDYLKTMQSLIKAMKTHCQTQERVYMPIIGAGNSSLSGKTMQALLRMQTEVLMFNTDLLKARAKILVYDDPDGKMRKDIRLYALRPHD